MVAARTVRALVGLLVLVPILAAVLIAALLLFGVEPQVVFLPGHFIRSKLAAMGFHVHNRVGVLVTVAAWWAIIVLIWLALRRARGSKWRTH